MVFHLNYSFRVLVVLNIVPYYVEKTVSDIEEDGDVNPAIKTVPISEMVFIV